MFPTFKANFSEPACSRVFRFGTFFSANGVKNCFILKFSLMKTISTLIAMGIICCTLTLQAQSFRWASHAGGPGEDLVRHSVTDIAGNTFVIGIFEDSLDFDPGPGTTMLVSRGGFDIFLAAYSPLERWFMQSK